jgi:hypothetical protein
MNALTDNVDLAAGEPAQAGLPEFIYHPAITPFPGKPESVLALLKALAKATLSFDPVVNTTNVAYMSKKGPVNYWYADQAEINRKTVRALAENGIVFNTIPSSGPAGVPVITATLWHEDGACMSASLTLPPYSDGLQDFGGALTYLHRYFMSKMLNLAGESEQEDGEGKPTADGEDTRAPTGEIPEALEKAKTVRELSLAMNAIPREQRARFMPYYNQRTEELENRAAQEARK